MPSNPEWIGKAHETLTRDILNNVDPQDDTLRNLDQLSKGDRERVQVGAEHAASFIKEHTPFEITHTTEEGDDRKPDPNDDVDLVVHGKNQTKGYSLKLTSDTAINVRNTLASKVAEDIFDTPLEELLTAEELATYERVTRKFASGEYSGSDMGAEMTPIFSKKFRQLRDSNESALRERLLNHIRLDSNMVACKVTSAGNFYGFASMEREPLRKFRDGDAKLEIYTIDSNNTSIFFDIDGRKVFRIDMYGQSQGSTRKPKIKTVYRVTFG